MDVDASCQEEESIPGPGMEERYGVGEATIYKRVQ